MQIFGPVILANQKLRLGEVRKTLRAYLPDEYVLSSQAIKNILRSVIKEVQKGDYKGPEKFDPDIFVFHRFTDDLSTQDVSLTLKKLLANQDEDTAWIVQKFMTETKHNDSSFDYRINLDVNNEVDCVVWQTGKSRGAFEKYGCQIFLDTRKSENMNSLDMRALSLVVIDANHSFIPASESFVFEESLESYRLVCEYTLEMTPGIKAEDVRFGFGDYFLNQEDVQVYFPNIIFLLDTYHFCSPTNDKCILLKDFGPKLWYIIQNDFRDAVYSKTERECLVRNLLH